MEPHREKKMQNGRLILSVCLALLISIASYMPALADDGDDLLEAARLGKINQVKMLIEMEVDPNIRDNRGKTPLILAARSNYFQVAQLLIDNGAELEATDAVFQRTALLFAVSTRGQLDMVKLLARKGANLKAADKRGITALMLAVKKKDIVSFLLSEGADHNVQDVEGWTALFYAASSGYLKSAELFIKAGAEINGKDNSGWTPLMYAVDIEETGMVSFLLDKGADPNLRNEEGKTALLIAVSYGNLPITRLLLANGADVKARNNEGESAADMAKRKGHIDIIKLLNPKPPEKK
jgi:ankyrin repeat protein